MTDQQIIDKYLNDFTREHGKPVPDELNLYIHKIINQALYLDALRRLPVISSVCKCKGGAVGRTVTADFEHQICDRCGNIAN